MEGTGEAAGTFLPSKAALTLSAHLPAGRAFSSLLTASCFSRGTYFKAPKYSIVLKDIMEGNIFSLYLSQNVQESQALGKSQSCPTIVYQQGQASGQFLHQRHL